MNKAIVYQHRRLDTNEIFYVGIGKSEKRAYSKHKRNKHWYNITNKTKYVVEIVYKNITYKKAKEIEKSLIKKYGRKDLGKGILCNQTDGGDGTLGFKMFFSEEHKNKLSNSGKNKIFTDSHKHNIALSKHKSVCRVDKKGNVLEKYSSMKEAGEKLNITTSHIGNVCRGLRKSTKGYIFKYG